MSKAGGKSTHLTGKKAKKGPSTLDDDDLEFQKKQQAEKKAMQAMATKAKGGGVLASGGIGSKKKK